MTACEDFDAVRIRAVELVRTAVTARTTGDDGVGLRRPGPLDQRLRDERLRGGRLGGDAQRGAEPDGHGLRGYEPNDGTAGRLTVDDAAFVVAAVTDHRIRDEIATLPDVPLPVLLDELCALARVAPDPDAAPLCAVVAWVALRDGNGAIANIALDRALGHDPRHSLALILRQMCMAMVPPRLVEQWTAAARTAVPAMPGAARHGEPDDTASTRTEVVT